MIDWNRVCRFVSCVASVITMILAAVILLNMKKENFPSNGYLKLVAATRNCDCNNPKIDCNDVSCLACKQCEPRWNF
jgi:hypothetical protein